MTMQTFALPAGARAWLTASSRPETSPDHKWAVEIFDAPRIDGVGPRLSYGSRIGGLDRSQRIDIPAQLLDCVVSVSASRQKGGAWSITPGHIAVDTPDELTFDFNEAQATGPDCSLAFKFVTPRPAA
jgi:hypothetical protein